MQLARSRFLWASQEPAGAVAEGGNCNMDACAAGMVCVGPDAMNVKCRRVCESAGDCVPGQACMAPSNGADFTGSIKICVQ